MRKTGLRILQAVMTALIAACGTAASAQNSPGSALSAVVTVIATSYTYPSSISLNGDYVAGSYFGGAGYFWSPSTGLVQVAGSVYGVAESGMVSGTYTNPSVLYNGSPVETAGIWNPASQQFTFLGMNPVVPQATTNNYNSGEDITSDGTTIVGMQWLSAASYSAYSWTQAGGYVMIGSGVGLGSRATGISANGTVVIGWAEVAATSRTPVVWYGGQAVFINNGTPGETFGVSPSGNYATGYAGSDGFRWSPTGTVTFPNTLMTGSLNPTAVTNDGTVFGYIGTNFNPLPTARRAFVREPWGTMETFNDYAEARGLPDAQLWTFYSINDASENGKKVIGAGKNPQGQAETFIMEFIDDLSVFNVSPANIDFGQVQAGTQSAPVPVYIFNTGSGNLVINSISLTGSEANRFILQDNNAYPKSIAAGDSMNVSVAFAPVAAGSHQASVSIGTATGAHFVPLTGVGIPETGITDLRQNAVHIYPVPASQLIHVDFPGGIDRIRLYNMLGNPCPEQSCSGAGKEIVNISGLPDGIYILECIANDGTVSTKRVIKSK
ncbi:MAG: choice-of-anchor D domain-containing protein [Bacteroidota bacterium]